MSGLNDDTKGAQLSAWLDRELPAHEALTLETALEADGALRKTAADFRQCDTLLREWYAALPVERVLPLPQKAQRKKTHWKFFTAAGVAAAAVAIVVLAFPAIQGRHAMTLAQYAMEKTAEALAHAKGMSADVRVAIVKHLDKPDEKGRTDEKRSATGHIAFGNLTAARLRFVSKERWDAVDDEPALTRVWGQNDEEQWLSERQGGSTNSFNIQETFDPAEMPPLVAMGGDREGGSPVDVRTRQAVEGLVVLLRSFAHDRFLRWMDCQWTFLGGTGIQGDAWLYTVQPFAKTGSPKSAETVVWTLRVWSSRADGVIDGVDLEETISNAATGAVVQSFRTAYSLKLSDAELDIGNSGADDDKPAKDDGKF